MRISDWSSDVCSSDLRCSCVRSGFVLLPCPCPMRGHSRHHASQRCDFGCNSCTVISSGGQQENGRKRIKTVLFENARIRMNPGKGRGEGGSVHRESIDRTRVGKGKRV